MILNGPNVCGGLGMLRQMREGIAACVFFDPQYRGVLDQMAYGNEGARQIERSALPQMSERLIHKFVAEIARVLRPSRYLMFWMDKHALCQATYRTDALQIVDLITWEKPRIGMGYRTRRKSEYLCIMQKPPIVAGATWSDHWIPDVWPEVQPPGHPHAKPYALQKRLIEAVTQPREFVVDPCAGNYGVMRAAHAAGRQFLGCDLVLPSCELPVEGYASAEPGTES